MKNKEIRKIKSKAMLIGMFSKNIECKIIGYMKDIHNNLVYIIEELPSGLQTIAYEHNLQDI